MLHRAGPLEVYFSFPDGVIGYDCVSCGSKCCRGHGWGGSAAELVQLGKRYPLLPMFAIPRQDPDDPLHQLFSYKSGCFFLHGDGRCGVEVDHGRAVKPHTCRTFPVNRLLKAGDLLIAELHFLCPLRLARPGDQVIRHGDVVDDLTLALEVATEAKDLLGGKVSRELLVHEAWLRDRPSEDLLTRLAVADVAAARWRAAPAEPSAAMVAAHRGYLARLRKEILRLLGVEGLLAEAPTERPELDALLPRLRMTYLRERPDRSPEESIDELLPQLGRRLLAGSIYLDLIAHLGSAITLEVVEQALAGSAVLLELLSRADQVPRFRPAPAGEAEDAYRITMYRNREAELQRLLAFIHDENPRRGLSLRQVFDELGLADPGLRMQLCRSFTPEALARLRFDG